MLGAGRGSRDGEFEGGTHGGLLWRLIAWPIFESGFLRHHYQYEQPNTPFCVGVKTVDGKVQIGSSTVLDDCVGTDSSTFTIGFTNTAATGGTIVRE